VTISYRATPAYGTSGSNSFSVSKQSGTASGDWIFIYISSESGPPQTATCTGFSEVNVASGSGADGVLLYRHADGSEGSTFSVTYSNDGGELAWVIATVSGAVGLDPATVATPNSPAEGTSIPVNGITLAYSGDFVLWFAGSNYSGAQTITPPSGFVTGGTPGGTNPACCVASNASLPAGATGTQTGSVSDDAWSSGVMVGLTTTTPPPSSGLLMASFL